MRMITTLPTGVPAQGVGGPDMQETRHRTGDRVS
ncbi:hypothetical protein J2S44_004643 [Catenuloplanes niger]|uniref:Uncharacterized protein n=1 Tax=Catenuloplanes niger TaxID=587534 RepID=A0AAE3ZQV3_9ACTN|nr:hypothetical protein [Catenuloplanes niger]